MDKSTDIGYKPTPENLLPMRVDFSTSALFGFMVIALIILYILLK